MKKENEKRMRVVWISLILSSWAVACSARTIHVGLSAVKEPARYIQYEPIELAVAFENELDKSIDFNDFPSWPKVSSFLEMRRADGAPVYYAGPSHPVRTHSPKRITLAPGEAYRGIVDINRPLERFEIHAGEECEVRVNAAVGMIGDERVMLVSDWIKLSIVDAIMKYEKELKGSIQTLNHPRRIPVVWTVYIDATERTKRLLYKQDVRTASEMPLDFKILGEIADQESLSCFCDEDGDLHLLMAIKNGELHKHYRVTIMGKKANRDLRESLRREGYNRATLAQVVDYYKKIDGSTPRLEVTEDNVTVVGGQRIPHEDWPTTQPASIQNTVAPVEEDDANPK